MAQGTELIVVLLVIYIHGTEQLLPPTMIRYMVWSWRDSRPHGVATVASDPSLGLESTTDAGLQNTLRAIIASRELQQSQLSLGSFAIGSRDFL